MQLEIEILDTDLADRKVLVELRIALLDKMDQLSNFGKNTIFRELDILRDNIERCELGWIKCQKERTLTKLSEYLNISRAELGDRCWSCGDND